MSQIDREEAKRQIVKTGQQLLRVASMKEGLFSARNSQFLLCDSLQKLALALQRFTSQPDENIGPDGSPVPVEEFVIHWRATGNDVCAHMLSSLVESVWERWDAARDEYWEAMARYYEGCEVDEDGDLIDVHPNRRDDPLPMEPLRTVTSDEREQLNILVHQFELTDESLIPADLWNQSEGQAISPSRKRSEHEPRDGWIYDKYIQGVGLAQIVNQLKELCRSNNWEEISDGSGIRKAVVRFTSRRGLPLPDRRQKANHRPSSPQAN